MEIEYGRFERRIPLADEVDADAATRDYERGDTDDHAADRQAARRGARAVAIVGAAGVG